MEWSSHTLANLTQCFKNERYKTWSDAVESGDINTFSEQLDELLGKLSDILAEELIRYIVQTLQEKKCGLEEMANLQRVNIYPTTERIVKFLELAALAGKTL